MNDTAMKFDLQLFADPSAALNNTSGTMTAEMKTFYEKRLIDQAEPRLVHDQFADYYPVPQNGGKTIEFRKYDSLPKASTPLTEGVTPNGQALNVTSITSDLHQYGGWTPLTDVLQMTAIDNNVVQATRVLASQAGRTMDSITRDVLAGGTNVIYAPKLAADGAETAVTSRKALDKTCTLTPKLFFQAAAQLGAMNADPIGDSYIAIIHPRRKRITSLSWMLPTEELHRTIAVPSFAGHFIFFFILCLNGEGNALTANYCLNKDVNGGIRTHTNCSQSLSNCAFC